MDNITQTKRVVIKHVNGGTAPQEIMVTPGVTAADVLRNMGLEGRGFTLTGKSANDAFASDEAIFGRVQDGDVLHVSSELTAGLAA